MRDIVVYRSSADFSLVVFKHEWKTRFENMAEATAYVREHLELLKRLYEKDVVLPDDIVKTVVMQLSNGETQLLRNIQSKVFDVVLSAAITRQNLIRNLIPTFAAEWNPKLVLHQPEKMCYAFALFQCLYYIAWNKDSEHAILSDECVHTMSLLCPMHEKLRQSPRLDQRRETILYRKTFHFLPHNPHEQTVYRVLHALKSWFKPNSVLITKDTPQPADTPQSALNWMTPLKEVLSKMLPMSPRKARPATPPTKGGPVITRHVATPATPTAQYEGYGDLEDYAFDDDASNASYSLHISIQDFKKDPLVNNKENPYVMWEERFFHDPTIFAIIVGYRTAKEGHYVSAIRHGSNSVMWYDNYDWNERPGIPTWNPFLSKNPPNEGGEEIQKKEEEGGLRRMCMTFILSKPKIKQLILVICSLPLRSETCLKAARYS